MRIAIVGVTGMVGQIILKVLAERSFPVTELIPVASEKSVGKQIQFGGRAWVIQNIEHAVSAAPDIALFSAGGERSKIFANKFIENGALTYKRGEENCLTKPYNPRYVGERNSPIDNLSISLLSPLKNVEENVANVYLMYLAKN